MSCDLRRAPRDEVEIGIESFDPLYARDRHINRFNDTIGDRRPETYVTQ